MRTHDCNAEIPGFYLPLIAVLVRRWLDICARRHPPNSRKILYLLTGREKGSRKDEQSERANGSVLSERMNGSLLRE